MFLGLSGDGSEPEDQRSTPRKAFMIAVALVYVLSVPLLWSATALADSRAPATRRPRWSPRSSNSGPGVGSGDDEQRPGERRR